MTPPEYRQWKSFALHMAARGWKLRRANRRRLVALVKEFFRHIDIDYCKYVPLFRAWCETDDVRTAGLRGDTTLVCDIATLFLGDMNTYDYYPRDSWGDGLYARWRDSWGSMVRCCVRAGLDLAMDPGEIGVLGFTVGDLRRMFRGRLPAWVADRQWEHGSVFGDKPGEPIRLDESPDAAAIAL